MKTNTTNSKSDEVMNKKVIKTESAVLDQDLFRECTYGLEYIIDELFPEGTANVSRQATMSWAGFDDLMI